MNKTEEARKEPLMDVTVSPRLELEATATFSQVESQIEETGSALRWKPPSNKP